MYLTLHRIGYVQAAQDTEVIGSSKGGFSPFAIYRCTRRAISLIGHVDLSPGIPAGITTKAFAISLAPVDPFSQSAATLFNAFRPVSSSASSACSQPQGLDGRISGPRTAAPVSSHMSAQPLSLDSGLSLHRPGVAMTASLGSTGACGLPAGSFHLNILVGQHAAPLGEASIFRSSSKKQMDMVMLDAVVCVGEAPAPDDGPEAGPDDPSTSTPPDVPVVGHNHINHAICVGGAPAVDDGSKSGPDDSSTSTPGETTVVEDNQSDHAERACQASTTGSERLLCSLPSHGQQPISADVHGEELLRRLTQHLDDRLDHVDATLSMMSLRLQRMEDHMGLPRMQ